MDGFIVNKSGKTIHIFKRKFAAGHKVAMAEIWPLFEKRVLTETGKKVVTEELFLGWLEERGYMQEGFEYNSGLKASVEGTIEEATSSEIAVDGIFADGRLERPSLANITQGTIDRLTYTDIANLRILDDPKKIIFSINNLSKLRRAYTKVRNMPRRAKIERMLHDRIQELERLS